MHENLFREKNLNRLKSPDSLDDYIKVANPGVWILLICIIFLLAGAFIWGIYGHIDSTAPTAVLVQNGTAVCYVQEEDIFSVDCGMTVRFSDTEAAIVAFGQKTEQGYPCSLQPVQSITDGYYEGEIVLKSTKPLSFIFN